MNEENKSIAVFSKIPPYAMLYTILYTILSVVTVPDLKLGFSTVMTETQTISYL